MRLVQVVVVMESDIAVGDDGMADGTDDLYR